MAAPVVAPSLSGRMRASLLDEWRQARPAQQLGCLVGGALVLVGLGHLTAWLMVGGGQTAATQAGVGCL